MRRYLSTTLLSLCFLISYAQEASLQGTVIDAITREPISNVSILIQGTTINDISDSKGQWSINLKPGLYNIEFSHISFESYILYEHRVATAQNNQADIQLFTRFEEVDEVTISASPVTFSAVNGTSIKTLEIDEIQRMPGAVMDISKIIKNFPGVSPRVSFGYNIIVRGGGSFENKYFLDGIEIPAITHFSVQGLSGGPNGLINTDLISRATFKSGSFPANRGNALSSVVELEQRAGRRDRFGTKLTLGAAEYGIHVEGPMTKHSSYIFSARKSYTEYLLKAFDLPVLPAFTDFQYKHQFWLPNKDQLTLIGLGAFDKYRLNLDAKISDALLYNTGYIPEGDQNTMVFGANYKHFTDKGVYSIVVSHTNFSNVANKYYNNTREIEDLALDYKSIDNETKFQVENKIYNDRSTVNYGISYDFVQFGLSQYNIFADARTGIDTIDFDSEIRYQKYGVFGSYAYRFSDKWNASVGARIDGNSFNSEMTNPFSQISPRLSLQYQVSPRLSATIQSGIYYEVPPNVLLGFQNDKGLVNQDNLEYIKSTHYSAGIDYRINKYRHFNMDVFYKDYDQYPFLLRDSISFANAGGEYVSVGNQEANSSSTGRAYGVEVFYQQKLYNNWFSNISASYVVSEFANREGTLSRSAWDNRFFANATLGRQFKNNWTIGAKFTYAGANPYTPYDEINSSEIKNWDANKRGIYDFNNLNEGSLPAFHNLDFRVDKKWFLKNLTIVTFLDIQNIYSNKFQSIPYLTLLRDDAGESQIDPENPSRYLIQTINSDTGRVLPTIGFSVEF